MAKFLFIYRESTESRPKPSPEEMQALQTAWYAWMQKFSSAIVPGGDGLKHTGRVLKAGLVTDGPYVEAKEIIVSFGIIQADNYDAARGDRPCVSARPHDGDPRICRLRMSEPRFRSISRKGTKNDCKEGHAEVRQEHRRDRQDVQGIHGRGTSRDEGARSKS